MKRDIDLCRQLLFDLEAHGSESAMNVLRSGLANEADDRVRYHLRLLADAGLVKEVDRTTNGVACVRLTHAGTELIELSRSDARWREAKAAVLQRTGGLSLTVLRAILTKWAIESASHGYVRRPQRAHRPYYRRAELPRRYEGYRYDRDGDGIDDDLQLVRVAPDYRERPDAYDRYYDADYYNGQRIDAESLEPNVGVQLPIYLV